MDKIKIEEMNEQQMEQTITIMNAVQIDSLIDLLVKKKVITTKEIDSFMEKQNKRIKEDGKKYKEDKVEESYNYIG